MQLSENLAYRGFFNQTTFEDIAWLDKETRTVYLGIDPTADSLHVGNLAIIMLMRHMLDAGHKVIMLVGGGTGMIGDPSGKDSERNLLDEETLAKNVAAISGQIEKLFDGKDHIFVNNADWLSQVKLVEFLRDIGKHYGMSTLVQRDYIASRIGEGGSGMSYTEFTYTLLQGYDYLRLHEEYGVDLQVGGSDQWGNIISGVDLIRRKLGNEVHAMTGPLVINKATGKKFGKSEAGAVWLDPEKTSPYAFYQFWLNSDDEGAIDYLKYFTLLSKEEIEDIEAEFKQAPQERLAQKTLAREMTTMIHGAGVAESVEKATEVLFGNMDAFGEAEQEMLSKELPTVEVDAAEAKLANVLVQLSLAGSKSEALRLQSGNAIAVNNQKVDASKESLSKEDFPHGAALLRKGKNAFGIVKLK